MTALFEMRIRLGVDPRGLEEYRLLCDELGKLNHPACPDVDWHKVEQLCLSLFDSHGAQLQSVAWYILARSHRYGPAGLLEGIGLLETLGREWPRLWPPTASGRVDTLTWLFAQLQGWLRSLETNRQGLAALAQLQARLQRLHELLLQLTPLPVPTLQALQNQLDGLMQRLAREVVGAAVLPDLSSPPAPAWVAPVVVLPPLPAPEAAIAQVQPGKSRTGLWLSFALVLGAALGGLWWWRGQADTEHDRASRLAGMFRTEQKAVDPVHLGGLRLFDAGTAAFKSGSSKQLINALTDIRARPGWLVVITGHSDITGNAGHNLQLSQARALAVRDWLQQMGDIPDSCFVVQGVADSQPVAANDTEDGRAANRRVDIRLMPQTNC